MTLISTVKDKRNIVSENLYDDLYRLTEQRRDNVWLISNEYDDAGNKTATVDAENHRVEYAYNSRNLLEKTTFVDGVDNFYAEQFYDGVGNVVSAFNEARQETVTTYDNENRKRTVTFVGEMSENLYDEVGNLTTAYKPKRNSRVMSYDGLNRLETVGEGSLTTTYTYDANGNLRTEEDPRGNLVEFTYDALNRKTAHIQHKGSGNLTVSYDLYDAEGNLKQTTDAKGQVFTYDYDELSRPIKTTYPVVTTPFLSIQEIVTGYDANNNVTSVTETKAQSGGGTVTDVTSNVWDRYDRLDSSTQRGVLLDYGYDNNGNRTSVVTANGSTTYTFDSRNRLETAVVGADTTTYSYTPVSQTDTITYPNGTNAKYTYWPTNRVETITHKAGETVISSFAYIYDDNGNRTQQIEVQGGVSETTAYNYDTLDRLENFTLTSGADTTVTAYTFEGYNRKTENVTLNAVPTVSKTYSYDETNWLTGVTDSVAATSVTYQYDANGNTTRKSASGSNDVLFVYDSRNQLVETTQGATLLGRYDYDAQGLRIRHRNSERGDVDYFYDDGAVLEERTASGGLLAHYRYGDRLLSLNTGSETQYYHHDALGSTVDLTDSTGAVQTRYTLDPWGHIRNQVGSSVNRMVFTGQEMDEQTGLIYFGARYYDPDSARFLTQDSYLGEPGTPPSLHRYLYAYSNPTVYVDLMGYASEDILSNLYSALNAQDSGKKFRSAVVESHAKINAAFPEAMDNAYSTGLDNGVPGLDNGVTRTGLTIATTLTRATFGAASFPLSKTVETIEYGNNPSQLQNFPVYASSVKNTWRASEAAAKDGSLTNWSNVVAAASGAVLETAAVGYGLKAIVEPAASPKTGITVESRTAKAEASVTRQPITDPRRLLPAPERSSPHLEGAPLQSETLPAGYRFNQAVHPDQTSPGRFGTDVDIPNLKFVREDLAVTEGFKPIVSGVREVEVLRPVVGQRSKVGPQEYNGKIHKGGADQIEILNYDPINPYVKFVGKEKLFK